MIEQYELLKCDMCGLENTQVATMGTPVGPYKFWTETILLCDKCHKKITKITLLKMEQVLKEYGEETRDKNNNIIVPDIH